MTQPPFTAAQLATSAEGALEVIGAVSGQAESLIQAWVKAGNAAAVLEVSERGTGAARKAARRGLNVLKSRGVSIPDPRRSGVSPSEEQLDVQALMLAPDVNGIVMFAVYSRSTTGRTRACFVLIRDSQGIVRIENGDLSQSKIKEQIRKAFPQASYDAIPVSLDWARSRIAAARETHIKKGLIEPLGFETASPLLRPLPAKPPSHPFDDEGFEFSDDDARDLAVDSAQLHQLPEFRRWFPPASEVDNLLRKLGSHFTQGQTPEPEQLAAWVKEEVSAATDRYFTPEQRADLQGCLKDAGLSVLYREGEQKALVVAATIQVIGKAGLVTNPPSEIPFLRGYFEKALSLLSVRNRGNLPIPVPSPRGDSTATTAAAAESAG